MAYSVENVSLLSVSEETKKRLDGYSQKATLDSSDAYNIGYTVGRITFDVMIVAVVSWGVFYLLRRRKSNKQS